MQIRAKRIWIIVLILWILFLPGCTAHLQIKDAGILSYGDSFIKTELLFGLSKPDGSIVTESEWQNFVDNHITPRFKEGLTILNSSGQWMLQTGNVIKEQSKIVMILHKNNQEIDQLLEKIRKEYKNLFQQESVLRITSSTAVSF